MDTGALLLQEIQKKGIDHQNRYLLVLDENFDEHISAFNFFANTDVITNRYDTYQQINSTITANQKSDINCYFNDFNFASLSHRTYSLIAFRIPKEKAVMNHLVNEACKRLQAGGEIIIFGKKSEGIKGLNTNIKKHLKLETTLKKNKENYLLEVQYKNENTNGFKELAQNNYILDDSDYHSLRKLDPKEHTNLLIPCEIYSKPGVYGWKKIDVGTLLLLKTFLHNTSLNPADSLSCLDLGCGSGLITVFAGKWGFKDILATDNNAASILACQHNIQINAITAYVEADNCAASVQKKFNCVLCNPPFHKGFKTEKNLTQKFLESSARHLKENGELWMVVNAFIGVEKIAKLHFEKVTTVINNKQFKVICCTHPTL